MAAKKTTGESRKIVFGNRRKGKYKKASSPKEAPQKKKYRGQGR
jgi:hypothetical protein